MRSTRTTSLDFFLSRPPPPPPTPPVPCPHEQQGEEARSFMVPDGGWQISTAASLHRSRPRFHLVLLAYCTQTRRMHTPHHQSSITNNNNNSSTAQQPPSRASQPRDLPGWGHVRGHILLRPSRRNSLSRTMQLDGASGLRAVRDSANASRNWLQQAEQRRTMMASASLGGGALAAVDSACAARARGTLPLSLFSPIWVVIARQPLVSVIWPAWGDCPTGFSPKPPFAM